jgi:hypothetical protein
VLKPLCGVDAELEQNLVTFFGQDHPHYELIFGVERGRRSGAAHRPAFARSLPWSALQRTRRPAFSGEQSQDPQRARYARVRPPRLEPDQRQQRASRSEQLNGFCAAGAALRNLLGD